MGSRGEGWVIGQFLLGAAILAATLTTRVQVPLFIRIAGAALVVIGLALLVLGVTHLGSNLTPFPKPKSGEHSLITTGVYGVVRHPIYSGFALGAVGWSVGWGSILGIALSLLLILWFDLKARREEAWLVEKYPDYPEYQARVKKLIPFLY